MPPARKTARPAPKKKATRRTASARRFASAQTTRAPATPNAETYQHAEKAVQRPDVGVQTGFTARKPPKTYRYDSSLDPQLAWDENANRELAEWLIGLIERVANEGESTVFAAPQEWRGGGVTVESLKGAAALLKTLSKSYLNWSGKAERHQINVPTVPLFVHERHSTKAILEGIRHRVARGTTLDLFGDAQCARSIATAGSAVGLTT